MIARIWLYAIGLQHSTTESSVQVPVSKGNGLKAEWGESPREPVTVKLQPREMSQTRACARNQKRRLVNGQLFPAGSVSLSVKKHP